MKKKTKAGNRMDQEDQKQLQAFHGAMERYLGGGKLSRDELKALTRLMQEKQDEGEKMNARDARETGKAVWSRVEEKMIAGRQEKGKQQGSLRRLHPSSRSVAALFMVLLGIGSLITWQVQRHAGPDIIRFAADGQIKKIQLSDSTVVFLNVGSTLALDAKTFNTHKRRVTLVGEAFFEVKKNPEKPFQVDGGELLTTVRGTSFDIKAYPETKDNVVSVRDGIVEVAEKAKGQLLATLVRNQQVSWDTEKNTGHTDLIDWKEAGGWIDGKSLVFNSAGLNEIILKARKYYNIELTVSGLSSRIIRLRGSFPANDHGKALIRQMCDIYGMKCDSTSRPGCIKLYQ